MFEAIEDVCPAAAHKTGENQRGLRKHVYLSSSYNRKLLFTTFTTFSRRLFVLKPEIKKRANFYHVQTHFIYKHIYIIYNIDIPLFKHITIYFSLFIYVFIYTVFTYCVTIITHTV